MLEEADGLLPVVTPVQEMNGLERTQRFGARYRSIDPFPQGCCHVVRVRLRAGSLDTRRHPQVLLKRRVRTLDFKT